MINTNDFVITPELEATLSTSPVARFDANIQALRVLKQTEAEDRPATEAEQAILGRYSGFGDSAFEQAFRDYTRDPSWKRRGDELREATAEDEYRAIEKSRINAFYTTPDIIRTMWKGLDQLGVNAISHPRVLEPSAGSGRFLGLQPAEMAARSQRTAVELDSLTGRLLKKLYPQTATYVMGFQEAPLPDDSFDVAVSNVPFGNIPVHDPAFRKGRALLTRSVHNYFFAKTLDKLRPGGVLAFITSHNTLDAPKAEPVREYLAEKADMLGAIRLPKGAFPDTEVVTDIIYMRKRVPGEQAGDQSWVKSREIEVETEDRGYPSKRPVNVNGYFLDHPEQVLGKHAATGSMYGGGEYTVELKNAAATLLPLMQNAIGRLPASVLRETSADAGPRGEQTPSAANVKEAAYVIDDGGTLMQRIAGVLVAPQLSAKEQGRVRAMLTVRDAARKVLNTQVHDGTDEEIEAAQKALGTHYDAFVGHFGALNAPANTALMRLDPDGPFLRALEWTPERLVSSDKAKTFKDLEARGEALPPEDKARLDKAASAKKLLAEDTLSVEQAQALKVGIFSERVARGLHRQTPTTAIDAMSAVLNETGRLDFDRMGALLGRNPSDVLAELVAGRHVFQNPTGTWEQADKYLSGNVRQKLEQAELAAKVNPVFSANAEALKVVQPRDLTPSQISVHLGAPWIPGEDVDDFIQELVGGYGRRRGVGYVRYSPKLAEWVKNERIQGNTAQMTSVWGTSRMDAGEIIMRVLNGKSIEVKDPGPDDKPVQNPKETFAAQEKAKAIEAKFSEWIWADEDRATRLSNVYNQTFNNMRPRRFDGEHMSFPGMTPKWAAKLHPQQKDAIWRVVQDGTTLLGHEVGFGKSAIMIAAGMELRRIGASRKNVFVTPKATQGQFRDQFLELYPYANVLYPGPDDFTPAKRSEFLSRAATGDWDAIILSGEQFSRIPVKPETEARFIRDEIASYRAALEAEEYDQARSGSRGKSQTHKDLQKALERSTVKLQEALAQVSAHKEAHTIDFEDMGVDQLFVDEADMYKNLRFTTRMGRVKGLPNSDSQRAFDMYEKVRILQEAQGGRGVVFATGTPIANTIAELYTQMRYLQEPMLEERGIQHFDAWAKTFGTTTMDIEQTVTGTFRPTNRFAKFQNIPELSNIWQTVADIRVADDSPNIVKRRPTLVDASGKAKRTVIAVKPDAALLSVMGWLAQRADKLGVTDPREDNMLKIAGDARKASLDVRMVDPSAPANPDGKLVQVARNVAKVYEETTPDRGTQLVFLDIGTPKANDKAADADPDSPQPDEDEIVEEEEVLRDIYTNLRQKLVASGVPDKDIAFIHEAKNDKQRAALFDKVNAGVVRVVIGSTSKMGAGVNIQVRAAALHHVDAPWRPRDIEQREGRVIRQGNEVYGPKLDADGNVTDKGKGVRIFTYVTERSFDAFMWQAIEAKAKAIKSIMRRDTTGPRTIDDADTLVMSAGEAKALATGDPTALKAQTLKNDLYRLQQLRGSSLDARVRAQQQLKALPDEISRVQMAVKDMELDEKVALKHGGDFRIVVQGNDFSERTPAGEKMRGAVLTSPRNITPEDAPRIGQYRGFDLSAMETMEGYVVLIHNPVSGLTYSTAPAPKDELTGDGLLRRIDNKINGITASLAAKKMRLKAAEAELGVYRQQATAQFPHQERMDAMQAELTRLEKKLQAKEGEQVEEAPIEIPPETTPMPEETEAAFEEEREETREEMLAEQFPTVKPFAVKQHAPEAPIVPVVQAVASAPAHAEAVSAAPAGLENSLRVADPYALSFEDLLRYKPTETTGVAANAGIKYRSARVTSVDKAGIEREYVVSRSDRGSQSVVDHGKTREQLTKERAADWAKLPEWVRQDVEANWPTLNTLQKTLLGKLLNGEKVDLLSVKAVVGGSARERILELFPNLKTYVDVVGAMEKRGETLRATGQAPETPAPTVQAVPEAVASVLDRPWAKLPLGEQKPLESATRWTAPPLQNTVSPEGVPIIPNYSAPVAQAESAKPYYVHHVTEGFIPADDAKPVVLEGMQPFAGVDLFVHKNLAEGQGYTVSEAKTGMAIAHGPTKKQAIEKAAASFARAGVKKVEETIARMIEKSGGSPRYENMPKGKQTPKAGDTVFAFVPGLFNMPVRLEGQVTLTGKTVKITAGSTNRKQVGIHDANWNVEGDPWLAEEAKRHDAEVEARNAALVKERTDLAEWQKKTLGESVSKSIASGETEVKETDLAVGDTVTVHYGPSEKGELGSAATVLVKVAATPESEYVGVVGLDDQEGTPYTLGNQARITRASAPVVPTLAGLTETEAAMPQPTLVVSELEKPKPYAPTDTEVAVANRYRERLASREKLSRAYQEKKPFAKARDSREEQGRQNEIRAFHELLSALEKPVSQRDPIAQYDIESAEKLFRTTAVAPAVASDVLTPTEAHDAGQTAATVPEAPVTESLAERLSRPGLTRPEKQAIVKKFKSTERKERKRIKNELEMEKHVAESTAMLADMHKRADEAVAAMASKKVAQEPKPAQVVTPKEIKAAIKAYEGVYGPKGGRTAKRHPRDGTITLNGAYTLPEAEAVAKINEALPDIRLEEAARAKREEARQAVTPAPRTKREPHAPMTSRVREFLGRAKSKRQTPRGVAQDMRKLSSVVIPRVPHTERGKERLKQWKRHPGQLDVRGVDTPKHAAGSGPKRRQFVAEITKPRGHWETVQAESREQAIRILLRQGYQRRHIESVLEID